MRAKDYVSAHIPVDSRQDVILYRPVWARIIGLFDGLLIIFEDITGSVMTDRLLLLKSRHRPGKQAVGMGRKCCRCDANIFRTALNDDANEY
jgi:hypothetical protein